MGGKVAKVKGVTDGKRCKEISYITVNYSLWNHTVLLFIDTALFVSYKSKYCDKTYFLLNIPRFNGFM